MDINSTVAYSFSLLVVYILLPLIPAVLIFRLFPDSRVSVSGPFQNLTINATGAFAAYVVTGLLGFFLVKNVETTIEWTRRYPVEGQIIDLMPTEAVDSYRFYSRSFSNSNDPRQTHEVHFVVIFDRPVVKTETVDVDYWETDGGGSGVGQIPGKVRTSIQLLPNSSLQQFRVRREGGQVKIENVSAQSAMSHMISGAEEAMNGGR